MLAPKHCAVLMREPANLNIATRTRNVTEEYVDAVYLLIGICFFAGSILVVQRGFPPVARA